MTLDASLVATVAAAITGSTLLGIAVACLLWCLSSAWLLRVRQILLAVLIPACCLALLPSVRGAVLPGLPMRVWPPLHLVLGALPVLLLPVLQVAARLPSGQGRAAAGLGAGRLATLRLVWLPQLGPAILLGAVLAGLLDLAALRPNG